MIFADLRAKLAANDARLRRMFAAEAALRDLMRLALDERPEDYRDQGNGLSGLVQRLAARTAAAARLRAERVRKACDTTILLGLATLVIGARKEPKERHEFFQNVVNATAEMVANEQSLADLGAVPARHPMEALAAALGPALSLELARGHLSPFAKREE